MLIFSGEIMLFLEYDAHFTLDRERECEREK